MAQRVKRSFAEIDRDSSRVRRAGPVSCPLQCDKSSISIHNQQQAIPRCGRSSLLLACVSATRCDFHGLCGARVIWSARFFSVRRSIARSRSRIVECSNDISDSLPADARSDYDRHRSQCILAPHGSQYRWVARPYRARRLANIRPGRGSRKPGAEAGWRSSATAWALSDASTLWRPNL